MPSATEEQALHRHLMRFGDHESLATPLWEERGTSVRAIAAYLASLWDNPVGLDDGGDPLVTEKGLPHARASVLNLIVTVVDLGAADRVVHTLLGLGVRHPSRAIVLVPDPGGGDRPVDARISTHCNEASGGGDRVCYEEIVLTVRGEAADHLSGVVAPLLIHDLPTHVWWPGDPPFADPTFDQLIEMGDRVLFDSADFGDLLAGLRRIASLRRSSGVGDMSWERLAWWQELTAQFFDAPRFRRYLPNLSRLQIRYAVPPPTADGVGGDPDEVVPDVKSPMAQALLYAGWIATRLGWRRDRTLEPLQDGAFRLRLEGKHEMVDLALTPPGDRSHSPRRAAVGSAPLARRDRGGRVHHRPRWRRCRGRHERRRHDRVPAPRGDGDAKRGRAAELAAGDGPRRPGVRGRIARRRDPPGLGA